MLYHRVLYMPQRSKVVEHVSLQPLCVAGSPRFGLIEGAPLIIEVDVTQVGEEGEAELFVDLETQHVGGHVTYQLPGLPQC